MHAATSAWHLVAQRRKGRLDEVGERRGLRARKDAGKEADDERGRGDATRDTGNSMALVVCGPGRLEKVRGRFQATRTKF